jgi:carbon monoxide dehydrogenase subunit G
MPVVQHTVEIKADPEAVFDLIGDVENFTRFTSAIDSIEPIEGDAYHWVVHVAGMVLE